MLCVVGSDSAIPRRKKTLSINTQSIFCDQFNRFYRGKKMSCFTVYIGFGHELRNIAQIYYFFNKSQVLVYEVYIFFETQRFFQAKSSLTLWNNEGYRLFCCTPQYIQRFSLTIRLLLHSKTSLPFADYVTDCFHGS